METLTALSLANQDADYWAGQTRNDYEHSQKYMDQAEALKLLLDEIKGSTND